MKFFNRNNLLPRLWWTFTGIAWLCLGYFLMTMCVGFAVIICGWICDSKHKVCAIISNGALVLYTIVFSLYSIMMIGVASPARWFAIALLLMIVGNIYICTKSLKNLFKS